jgi:hypothetical protein
MRSGAIRFFHVLDADGHELSFAHLIMSIPDGIAAHRKACPMRVGGGGGGGGGWVGFGGFEAHAMREVDSETRPRSRVNAVEPFS